MKPVERPFPADHDEAAADESPAGSDLFEAEESDIAVEQLSFQVKIAELEASNHKLLVENVALRARIEGLKSRRSLERMLILSGTALLWIVFMFSFLSKIAASSG